MRSPAPLVAVLVLRLAGCGGAVQSTHLDSSPDAYPADLQGSLLGACTGAAAASTANLPSTYCQCALSQLEANVPPRSVGDPTTAGMAMVTDRDILNACDH